MEIYDQLGLADQVVAGANNAVKFQIGDKPGAEGFNIAQLQEGSLASPGSRCSSRAAMRSSCTRR